MSKIAILNDTHLGVKNGADIFLDNLNRFYEEIFFPYLLEHNIKDIIHLGDYYDHRKYVNFKALDKDNKCFLTFLKDHDINMHLIIGNHDTYYKQDNNLNSLSLLLGHHDNIKIIYEPETVEFDGTSIDLIPWITQENQDRVWDFVKKSKSTIVGGHFELAGFDMMKGAPMKSHGTDHKKLSKYEIVMSGHYHTKSIQDNIHYFGTQVELTWSDCNDPKYFHVLDTNTLEIEPIRNTISLFHKLYYSDSDVPSIDKNLLKNSFVKVIVKEKKDLYEFDKFIDRVNKCDPFELKITEVLDEYLGENVADDEISTADTTTLLNTYIDSTETDLNKTLLKDLINELYVEAQNSDIL